MADSNNKDSCNSCKFFADLLGSCRRYPRHIMKSPTDYCGEHSVFENKVFDTITEKLGGFELNFIQPPKRRGRPPKKC